MRRQNRMPVNLLFHTCLAHSVSSEEIINTQIRHPTPLRQNIYLLQFIDNFTQSLQPKISCSVFCFVICFLFSISSSLSVFFSFPHSFSPFYVDNYCQPYIVITLRNIHLQDNGMIFKQVTSLITQSSCSRLQEFSYRYQLERSAFNTRLSSFLSWQEDCILILDFHGGWVSGVIQICNMDDFVIYYKTHGCQNDQNVLVFQYI